MNTDFISHSLHLTELQQQQRSLYLKGMSREFPVKKKQIYREPSSLTELLIIVGWHFGRADHSTGGTYGLMEPVWLHHHLRNWDYVGVSPSAVWKHSQNDFLIFYFFGGGEGCQHWYLLSHCSLLWVAVVLMRPRHQCCVCRYEQRHVSATDTVQTCFPGGHVTEKLFLNHQFWNHVGQKKQIFFRCIFLNYCPLNLLK